MPDARGWVTVALIALAFYILTLVAFVPNLADNELFKTLATVLITSGLVGGALAFYFSSTKGSADKDATIAKQLDKPS